MTKSSSEFAPCIPRWFSLVAVIATSTLLTSCVAQSGYVAVTQPSAPQVPETPNRVIKFDTTEGTLMSVDVSPDGETLIFDLLGDLYLLPFTGGEAVTLTSGRAWDQAPRFSPDGKSVYFVSDRSGYKNIWHVILADLSVIEQITDGETDIVGTPNWSQDGTQLLVGVGDVRTRGSEVILHSIDSATGVMNPLELYEQPWVSLDTFELHRDRVVTFSGVQAANGEVYVAEAKPNSDYSKTTVRIYKIDPATRKRDLLTPADADYNEFKPQLSHDSKLLAYLRQYSDRHTELRILDRSTGRDRALFQLSDADDASYYASHELWPNYAFSPDDQHIFFWQAGKIHRARLEDGVSEIIPFHVNVEREVWARVEPSVQKIKNKGEAQIIRWPSLSDDGQTMVFAAIGYIWIMDIETGNMRRLTDGTDFEYMPALSPDGRSVAYISFAQLEQGYGTARLIVAGIDGASSRELLTSVNGMYLLPKWSDDGGKIALIRDTLITSESAFGIRIDTMFGWTDVQEGVFREVAPAPASGTASLYVDARAVGFDHRGETLWFNYPVSKNETVLSQANLDGSGLQTLATGSGIRGIAPAPDLKHLVFTDMYGTVWLTSFAVDEEPVRLDTSSAGVRQVSLSGGYYVGWVGVNKITYGFSQNFYQYDVANNGLEISGIKVTFDKLPPNQRIAFTGARLITMSNEKNAERAIGLGTIIVEGQRIVAIGSTNDVKIPSGTQTISLSGKTIMPGLLDTHYHRIGGHSGPAAGLSAFKFPYPDFEDVTAIAYGVTSAWEPSGPVSDGSPATVDLQVAGRIAGPRWSHSAKGAVGSPYELLTNYDAAFAAVKQHKELGVDVVKEYSAPTRKQRQWLSTAAHAHGVGIVSHIDNFDGMMTRIVDGYTGGDHPYIPVPFFKDVLELLKQTGYIWTPNVVITSGTVATGQRRKDYFCHAVSEWQKQTTPRHRDVEPICPPEPVKLTVPFDIPRSSRVAKQAAKAAADGVHIGVSAHGMPGSNLHKEMWYLWKGGMPIEEVLHATTIGNAEKLGLQNEIGSLEVGKVADFLVLDANPLDDILNTLTLKYTVQGGVVYDSDTAERVDVASIATTETEKIH